MNSWHHAFFLQKKMRPFLHQSWCGKTLLYILPKQPCIYYQKSPVYTTKTALYTLPKEPFIYDQKSPVLKRGSRSTVSGILWNESCILMCHNCNTLHHTATHCNTLQHTPRALEVWSILYNGVFFRKQPVLWCVTLQHTAAHCNTRHHTATNCNTLQHTATPCSVLHPAAHCNTLQHTTCYVT